jgi:hypothetical protein
MEEKHKLVVVNINDDNLYICAFIGAYITLYLIKVYFKVVYMHPSNMSSKPSFHSRLYL